MTPIEIMARAYIKVYDAWEHEAGDSFDVAVAVGLTKALEEEGFAIVPVEPTREMREAIAKENLRRWEGGIEYLGAVDGYKAMLKAAK